MDAFIISCTAENVKYYIKLEFRNAIFFRSTNSLSVSLVYADTALSDCAAGGTFSLWEIVWRLYPIYIYIGVTIDILHNMENDTYKERRNNLKT